MSILVVGSLCVDHTLYVCRLPSPGETTIARSALTSFGGKGANQAIAARLAGGNVSMIGCLGDDPAGHDYRQHFARHEIDPESLIVDTVAPTGTAFIGVEESGENSIIVNPGANHGLRPEHLDHHLGLFEKATHLLLQLEIPFDTIRHACKLARENGLTIIINPSPWSDEFNTIDFPCDILVVNSHEAFSFQKQADLNPSAAFFDENQLQTLIVTRGSDTTLAFSASGQRWESPPPDVTPVDTVGAGDVFAGSLTLALAEGLDLPDSIAFANTAAALSTLKAGAQGGIPTRDEIESHLH